MTTETVTTIKIMKEDLLEPLKIVSGVIESSQVIQILSFVRIIGEGNQLKLMTSNSEVQLEAKANIAGDLNESIDFAVPCKKLLNIARNISNDVLLTLVYDDQWLTVKTESSSFQLATLTSSQFPEFNAFVADCEHNLPEESLKLLIEKTSFSMAQQDVRFFLNGLLLQSSDQGLEAVATDGHRMAFGCLSDIKGDQIKAIVPRKTIFELLRLLSDSDKTLSIGMN